jgi:hypothetical protein
MEVRRGTFHTIPGGRAFLKSFLVTIYATHIQLTRNVPRMDERWLAIKIQGFLARSIRQSRADLGLVIIEMSCYGTLIHYTEVLHLRTSMIRTRK